MGFWVTKIQGSTWPKPIFQWNWRYIYNKWHHYCYAGRRYWDVSSRLFHDWKTTTATSDEQPEPWLYEAYWTKTTTAVLSIVLKRASEIIIEIENPGPWPPAGCGPACGLIPSRQNKSRKKPRNASSYSAASSSTPTPPNPCKNEIEGSWAWGASATRKQWFCGAAAASASVVRLFPMRRGKQSSEDGEP